MAEDGSNIALWWTPQLPPPRSEWFSLPAFRNASPTVRQHACEMVFSFSEMTTTTTAKCGGDVIFLFLHLVNTPPPSPSLDIEWLVRFTLGAASCHAAAANLLLLFFRDRVCESDKALSWIAFVCGVHLLPIAMKHKLTHHRAIMRAACEQHASNSRDLPANVLTHHAISLRRRSLCFVLRSGGGVTLPSDLIPMHDTWMYDFTDEAFRGLVNHKEMAVRSLLELMHLYHAREVLIHGPSGLWYQVLHPSPEIVRHVWPVLGGGDTHTTILVVCVVVVPLRFRVVETCNWPRSCVYRCPVGTEIVCDTLHDEWQTPQLGHRVLVKFLFVGLLSPMRAHMAILLAHSPI